MLSLTLMIYFQRRFFLQKKVTKGCRQTMAHTTRTHDTNWHRKAPLSSSSSAASSSTSRERSYSLYFGIARIRQLHWLPVRRRVDFKISTLVYRSLAGTAPVFLGDECTLVTAVGRRPLRSADNRTCLVVKRSRNQFGDRCFATAGPTLWNSLPEQLRQPDITFGQFKRLLKTFMFD